MSTFKHLRRKTCYGCEFLFRPDTEIHFACGHPKFWKNVKSYNHQARVFKERILGLALTTPEWCSIETSED